MEMTNDDKKETDDGNEPNARERERERRKTRTHSQNVQAMKRKSNDNYSVRRNFNRSEKISPLCSFNRYEFVVVVVVVVFSLSTDWIKKAFSARLTLAFRVVR